MTAAQQWAPWYVGAWVLWGLVFAVLEAGGLLHRSDRYPPLTEVVHRYIPTIVTVPGLIWLAWHGYETYQNTPSTFAGYGLVAATVIAVFYLVAGSLRHR